MIMSISSLYLDAFKEVAKTENFSEAALNLHVTQSALSQRVKNLEKDLSLTLFIRTPSGTVLTEQGLRLLRYCQTKDSLENELMGDLKVQNSKELSGILRIGTYSSIYRSAILPALSTTLQKNQKVSFEFVCAKMNELPGMLNRGEVDLITLDYELKKSNLEKVKLGTEVLVLIESRKNTSKESVFLDNDSNDLATENFFKHQKRKVPAYSRAYFDDCYGIIDGVCEGAGRAVMPQHLIKNNKKIKIDETYKPMEIDVWLHYFKQPFYSKLQLETTKKLEQNCKSFLFE